MVDFPASHVRFRGGFCSPLFLGGFVFSMFVFEEFLTQSLPTIRKQYPKDDTVDGRNPAPVDR